MSKSYFIENLLAKKVLSLIALLFCFASNIFSNTIYVLTPNRINLISLPTQVFVPQNHTIYFIITTVHLKNTRWYDLPPICLESFLSGLMLALLALWLYYIFPM